MMKIDTQIFMLNLGLAAGEAPSALALASLSGSGASVGFERGEGAPAEALRALENLSLSEAMARRFQAAVRPVLQTEVRVGPDGRAHGNVVIAAAPGQQKMTNNRVRVGERVYERLLRKLNSEGLTQEELKMLRALAKRLGKPFSGVVNGRKPTAPGGKVDPASERDLFNKFMGCIRRSTHWETVNRLVKELENAVPRVKHPTTLEDFEKAADLKELELAKVLAAYNCACMAEDLTEEDRYLKIMRTVSYKYRRVFAGRLLKAIDALAKIRENCFPGTPKGDEKVVKEAKRLWQMLSLDSLKSTSTKLGDLQHRAWHSFRRDIREEQRAWRERWVALQSEDSAYVLPDGLGGLFMPLFERPGVVPVALFGGRRRPTLEELDGDRDDLDVDGAPFGLALFRF